MDQEQCRSLWSRNHNSAQRKTKERDLNPFSFTRIHGDFRRCCGTGRDRDNSIPLPLETNCRTKAHLCKSRPTVPSTANPLGVARTVTSTLQSPEFAASSERHTNDVSTLDDKPRLSFGTECAASAKNRRSARRPAQRGETTPIKSPTGFA